MHSERPRRRRARPAAEASSGAVPVGPGITGGQYRPLANAEVWRIIDAAYAVLEQTGIEVMPSPAREVFARAGALDVRAAASARARAILAEHWPQPIRPELDRELRRRYDILLPAEAMRPGTLSAA